MTRDWISAFIQQTESSDESDYYMNEIAAISALGILETAPEISV